MEGPIIFTVQELVHGRRPLTAADSLHAQLRTTSVSSEPRSDQSSNSRLNLCSYTNPNPRILKPLNLPAIIVGTVTLPVAVSEGNSNSAISTFKCPYGSCLQFSDGSAMICCDVLDLDLGIIGKKIRVLAWNFLPIKRGGGFLEIIRWSFSDVETDRPRCSETHSFQLDSSASPGCVVDSKSRHCLKGMLELISPISVNPCSSGVSDLNPAPHLRGFLVRLKMCECRQCSSGKSIQDLNNHCFTKPVIVYLCGSASSWHPVITKLVGRVVRVSGLKKKLIYLGNKESCLVYVTAENSYLHLPSFKKNLVLGGKTCIEGLGECGSYTGVVKGVYLQGMIVELENEVWLLLTNHLLNAPHSLRVGALISVRNVHFLNPKFSWSKMLILGACYKTSIMVKCFSPRMAGCYILSHSESMLGNFIESIAFSARLWVLLIISCFRKKFSGVLSEKEILGTKSKEGLVQMYANVHIPSNLLRSSEKKHGVFMSLCTQSLYCCEGHNGKSLKLVLPICTFIHRCSYKWIRTVGLEIDRIYCEGRTYERLIRKVFSSEKIGIVLIGSLKISQSSGRLQLVDATGEVDIVVPDLPESWNTNEIYEVADYSLVIEGIPGSVDYLGLADEPLSCRSIFNFIPKSSELNLTVYVHFYMRSTGCKNILLYPHSELGEDFESLKCGKYHLLQVNHKFPVLKKFRNDSAIPNTPSVFVEAVIYSCNLLLSGDEGFVCETKDYRDDLKTHTGHHGSGVLQEHLSKRRKTDNASRTFSGSVDFPCTTVRRLSSCTNFDTASDEKQINETRCSATVRTAKNQRAVRSATLHYSGSDTILSGSGINRPVVLKILLEFTYESLHTFESLQIGCYYITEHFDEKCICKYKDSNNIGGVEFCVSPEMNFWSLSFSHDVPLISDFSKRPLSDDTSSDSDKVSFKDHSELRLRMLGGDHLETSSDVFLFVPANRTGVLKVNNDKLEEGMIKSVERHRGIPDNNFLLPEGNLISLRGCVIATHNVGSNNNCQNHGDTLQSRKFIGAKSCLHLLVEQRTVKIFGFVDNQFFPPGFGPGVDVTFHRVLELSEKDRWMLTPVSFIVINSLRLADTPSTERSSSSVLEINGITSLENLCQCLISEIVQHPDCKLRRLRCRVVAVNILVFEINRHQNLPSSESQVDIPIAGFVLDDGSSPCYCWTSAKRAATFLRLNEKLPNKASKSNDQILNEKAMMENNTCHSIEYRLRRILQKHTRITVKNFGSLLDSSYQELAVSVSCGNTLNRSDENFLKFVVFNACAGPSWTVVASIMDSDTISHLEKQHNLLQLEMDTSFMQNIWAKEVHFTSHFTEASALIQELLGSGGPVK